jgi:glycosyltransferase involved in cell wall biosynthesis
MVPSAERSGAPQRFHERPMSLSAVVIAMNEESAIGACLDSLAWCQEIVVVDSGSTDRTREIAMARGARLIEHEWEGYGRQKNFAVRQATNDWVLCVDADEIVGAKLRASIEKALAAPAFRAYEIARCNRFMGVWLRHGEGYPDWILRLFDRRSAQWSDDPVHEKVVTGERVGRLDGDLLHDSADSLHSYLEKQNRYTTLQAEALHLARIQPSVPKMVFGPIVRFVKFYFLRLGFLDGVPGLVHILIGCNNTLMKNAKLIALSARKGDNDATG